MPNLGTLCCPPHKFMEKQRNLIGRTQPVQYYNYSRRAKCPGLGLSSVWLTVQDWPRPFTCLDPWRMLRLDWSLVALNGIWFCAVFLCGVWFLKSFQGKGRTSMRAVCGLEYCCIGNLMSLFRYNEKICPQMASAKLGSNSTYKDESQKSCPRIVTGLL